MPDSNSDASPTLRKRQSERVREEIRAAFVKLAVERGVHAFSMHDVAETAGVSHRTLYRYYPSRDALINGVLDDAFVKVEAAKRTTHAADELGRGHPDAIAGAFEAFEQHADLVRTAARIREANPSEERREARTEAVRSYLQESGVDPSALDALTVLVRMLTGSDGWIRMTSPEFGLESREAGLAAHWAAQVLIRAAAERHGPLRPTFDDAWPTTDATRADLDDTDG